MWPLGTESQSWPQDLSRVVHRPRAVEAIHFRLRLDAAGAGLGTGSPQHRGQRSLPARVRYPPSPDSQAAGEWNTQQGGSYYSVGVEGGVMGRGAHDIMLDDLYANMEEAASPVIREKVRKWYSGTIYNRCRWRGEVRLD